jgi:hypothetical protein
MTAHQRRIHEQNLLKKKMAEETKVAEDALKKKSTSKQATA